MKTILDDLKSTRQYDSQEVHLSLGNLSQQFATSWHDAQFVNLNFDPKEIKSIVIAGMGGSNLSGWVAQSLSPFLTKVPLEIVANYRLPQYVDQESLVILVSYSGNTEETLSCAQDATKRGCNTIVITAGGKLQEVALHEHWPLLLLDEKLNTSHIPRYGLGLMLGATLGLFVRLNPEAFRVLDPKEIIRVIDRGVDNLSLKVPTENNPAKSLAIKNKGQSFVIFAANHLTGVAKIGNNFLNETAKSFCSTYTIPDLNHHLMEGLTYPTSLKDNTRFILLDSSLYPEVIQKRFGITKDILIKQKYQLTVIKPESTDIISQVFESLVFLVMFSYYLSIVNRVDPGTNPWVDFFKKQLK